MCPSSVRLDKSFVFSFQFLVEVVMARNIVAVIFVMIILTHAGISKINDRKFHNKMNRLGMFHNEPSESELKLWGIYKLKMYKNYLSRLRLKQFKSGRNRLEKRGVYTDSGIPVDKIYAMDFLTNFVK